MGRIEGVRWLVESFESDTKYWSTKWERPHSFDVSFWLWTWGAHLSTSGYESELNSPR